MAFIFWLSSIPGDRLPLPGFRFGDKLAHFLAYAILGLLIAWRKSLRPGPGAGKQDPGDALSPGPRTLDFRGAAIGMLYGLSDEIHQLFVPLRLFSWADFAADALGVWVGVAAGVRLFRRGASRKRA